MLVILKFLVFGSTVLACFNQQQCTVQVIYRNFIVTVQRFSGYVSGDLEMLNNIIRQYPIPLVLYSGCGA